jgi:pilus assembly protein CpaB
MYRNRMFRTVVLPLVVAFVATAALYFVIGSGRTGPTQTGVQTGQVAVAMRPIPARTVITGDMVAMQDVPLQYIAGGTLRSLGGCVGRIALVPLAAGEILMDSNVTADQPTSAGLSYAIVPGKRAMTIQVDEISGVAGFPQVGDRLDVFLALTSTGGEKRARLVLEDLLILAVGQESMLDPVGQPEELRAYTSVTLEVTPEEAATLALAETLGRLRLVLRSVLDDRTIGEFEMPSATLLQPVRGIMLNPERRVSFDLRVAEIDHTVLAGLGYGDLSGSVVRASGWLLGQLDASLQAGKGRVIQQATLGTNNRIGVTYQFTAGARAKDAAPGTPGTPYGITVWLRPSYLGQPFVNLDVVAQMQTADVDADGGPPSGRSTTLTDFERVPSGDGLLVLGLLSPSDVVASREGVTRMVLPGSLSDLVISGARVLIVVIAPSV